MSKKQNKQKKHSSILDNMFSPEVEAEINSIVSNIQKARRKKNAAKTSIELKKIPDSNINKSGYTPKAHPGKKGGKRKRRRKTKKRHKTKKKPKKKHKRRKTKKKHKRRGGFKNTEPVLNKNYIITREGSEEGYPNMIYTITKIGQNYIYFNDGTIYDDDPPLYVDKPSFNDLFKPYN